VADDPDASAIAGLLADADRRRVFAAIELGAGTLDDITTRTELPQHRAAKALGKLLDGQVVVTSSGGTFAVDGEALRRAARDARQRAPSTEHADEPDEVRKVLDAFVRDGRVTSMPAALGKRRVVLDWLARRFEPGHRYLEAEVTSMLDGHVDDPVTLRRYLVDEGFLDRSHGMYWRSGGTFDVSDSEKPPPE
jgi:hypothetical protein